MNVYLKKAFAFILVGLLIDGVLSQTVREPFPVKRAETPDTWKSDGWAAIDRAKNEKVRRGPAKNVILFVGDGMGISTVTAARIFEGQLRGESGEENRLSFENFPNSAFSKTYSANQQTSDSAPTMSAIVTGVKTNEGLLSVSQRTTRGDHTSVAGNETTTLLELAEDSGRSTGVVTTTRVTHATPAACYAHTADRDWESDADVKRRKPAAFDAGFPDIARQLIDFKRGDGIEVVFGGGRSKFMSSMSRDPEYPDKMGERLDGRNLIDEWVNKHKGGKYVWDKKGFDSIDAASATHVIGLFEPSHLKFEHDRPNDPGGEPSLTEMTNKAIDILKKNKKGFFLMVEGGRIDHAHHNGNAYRALSETVEFSNAIRSAASRVNLDDTLIIVTADHSHTLTIGGYPVRGNNILGLVRETDDNGLLEPEYRRDLNGFVRTTLSYANGRGARKERLDLNKVDTTDPEFLQDALIPLADETHAGEDVPIFATGAGAYLVKGSMEENWIFYVMADAMRLGRR